MLQYLPGAISLGASLFSKKKKVSAPNYSFNLPSYDSFKSSYDDSASGDINDFYAKRMKGEGVGYGADDLNTMNAAAIDNAAGESKDYERRAMAGATFGGGMSTGGREKIRRSAISQGLASRSNAMRDVAISNAVLKRKEISEAGQGRQAFLGGERSQQSARYNAAAQAAMASQGVLGNAGAQAGFEAVKYNNDQPSIADNLMGTGLGLSDDMATSRLSGLFSRGKSSFASGEDSLASAFRRAKVSDASLEKGGSYLAPKKLRLTRQF